MTESFRKGARVKWNWGQGVGRGRVAERFERRVERTIEGSKIRRNGTHDNPAYLVEADTGGQVLKLASELSKPDFCAPSPSGQVHGIGRHG